MAKHYEHPAYHGLAGDPDLKNDKRQAQWAKEFKEFGGDETYNWSFDAAIISFINKHLDNFLEHKLKYHLMEEDRKQDYLNMAKWLKCDPFSADEKEINQYNKGVELLFQYFHTLWI